MKKLVLLLSIPVILVLVTGCKKEPKVGDMNQSVYMATSLKLRSINEEEQRRLNELYSDSTDKEYIKVEYEQSLQNLYAQYGEAFNLWEKDSNKDRYVNDLYSDMEKEVIGLTIVYFNKLLALDNKEPINDITVEQWEYTYEELVNLDTVKNNLTDEVTALYNYLTMVQSVEYSTK